MSYSDISDAARSVNGVSVETILAELARMSTAQPFRRSPRLAKFLSYTVHVTVDGKADTLKEYSIGVQVFSKPVDFDPRMDSIVRVEARRLRGAVERYYANEGADSEIRIVYRAGSYAPSFHNLSEMAPHSFGAPKGSSSMMVLVGSSEMLEQIRLDLEKRHGLVQADDVENSVHALSRGEAASIARTEPGVPVFLIGTSLSHVVGAMELDGMETAI
jgi:hypothetical protein